MAERKPLPWEEVTHGQAFDFFFLALSGHCACFWPFTRKHFGLHALQLNGLSAMGVMWLYCAFAPCVEMIHFFVVWLALVVFHRVVTLGKCWRGWQEHSLFDGVPWLTQMIVRPRPNELVAKMVCEPVLCLLVAALLYQPYRALSAFVAAGAVSLVVKKAIERSMEDAQIRVMRDKEFEMRQRFDRYRARR